MCLVLLLLDVPEQEAETVWYFPEARALDVAVVSEARWLEAEPPKKPHWKVVELLRVQASGKDFKPSPVCS